MNFFKSALCLSAAVAFSATANADLKVATIDGLKLFNDYYKTHELKAELEVKQKNIIETDNIRSESIKERVNEYNALTKQLAEPVLSDKDRKDIAQKVEIKKQELIALEQQRRGHRERQVKALQEQTNLRRIEIIKEITRVTEEEAKKGSYDIVIDKSARTLDSRPIVPYTKPSFDITPSVLKELNKNAPKDFDPNKKDGATPELNK